MLGIRFRWGQFIFHVPDETRSEDLLLVLRQSVGKVFPHSTKRETMCLS